MRERFLAKVKRAANGCLEWTAYRTPDGYGRFQVGRRSSRVAHRVAYELFIGPIPEGHEIDHLCGNRACVNPTHLEAVTHRENLNRASLGAYNLSKKRCPRGHPYDEQNTYRAGSRRHCKICRREAMRRYRRRQSEARRH